MVKNRYSQWAPACTLCSVVWNCRENPDWSKTADRRSSASTVQRHRLHVQGGVIPARSIRDTPAAGPSIPAELWKVRGLQHRGNGSWPWRASWQAGLCTGSSSAECKSGTEIFYEFGGVASPGGQWFLYHNCTNQNCTRAKASVQALSILSWPIKLRMQHHILLGNWPFADWQTIKIKPRQFRIQREMRILPTSCVQMRQTMSGWWFGTWILWLSIYWECHNPNWRTHIFQRGRLNHQPDSIPRRFWCLTPSCPFHQKLDPPWDSWKVTMNGPSINGLLVIFPC